MILRRRAGYGRIASSGQARLENLGHNGGLEQAGALAMSIVAGKTYNFSCWLRTLATSGDRSRSRLWTTLWKQLLTTVGALRPSAHWEEQQLQISGHTTAYGKLLLTFEGTGTVDLDCVSFYDNDTWHKHDAKWSQGKLRCDLIEVLQTLKPAFLRFPGGLALSMALPPATTIAGRRVSVQSSTAHQTTACGASLCPTVATASRCKSASTNIFC